MKIGIFEIVTNHYQMLYAVSLIFNYNDNELFLFVDSTMYKKILIGLGKNNKQFRFIIKEKNEDIKSYLRKCNQYIKEQTLDLLLINTLDRDYFQYLSFLKKVTCKKILTVHNSNLWFKPHYSFHWTIIRNNIIRKMILRQVNVINVLDEKISNYIKTNCNYKKRVLVLPYSIYENKIIKKAISKKTIKIAIPGSIEIIRRDYHSVLKVFEQLHETGFNFILVLLGSPTDKDGKGILKKAKKIKNNGCQIIYYNTYVDNKEFEKQIISSHIILSPIKVATIFQENPEVYGKTKATGAIFDMIRYSKPGIVPVQLAIPNHMNNSILKYQDENELYAILKESITNLSHIENLTLNAQKNSKQYSIYSVRKRILPTMKRIIQNNI